MLSAKNDINVKPVQTLVANPAIRRIAGFQNSTSLLCYASRLS